MKAAKRTKPKPSHWVFTVYWWNPVVYVLLLIALLGSIWEGGIKEWVREVKIMIKTYDWN